MADYSNYSFDMVKASAFEREIIYISTLPIDQIDEAKMAVIEYMKNRINEIKEKYRNF